MRTLIADWLFLQANTKIGIFDFTKVEKKVPSTAKVIRYFLKWLLNTEYQYWITFRLQVPTTVNNNRSE